jgi:uncharacterized protein YndB with AHSA1/START domain
MNTRQHTHAVELTANPEEVFKALLTPSAIRRWWGATDAIVCPQEDGVWSAVWGAGDDPDYLVSARINIFDPPQKLSLSDYRYFARAGALPFKTDMTLTFTVESQPAGCVLRVVHEGFPDDAVADEFYAACEAGWHKTFDGIRRFFEPNEPSSIETDKPERTKPEVTGIGGIFFKAEDAVKLREWYKTHLGIKVEDYGGAAFNWREAEDAERKGMTIWSIFASDTRYLDPSHKPFMLNYRVQSLDEMLAYLRSQNIEVDERVEDSEFGRFGWAMDIEGNRIGLWQPPEGL